MIVNYDDSDGWYDHVYSGVTNPSLSPADNLTNTSLTVPTTGTSGQCGASTQGTGETPTPLGGEEGRCGFGPRLPMMVISPYAKKDAVDHNLSDLASIPNFIEYNWGLPGIPGSFDHALAGTNAAEGAAFDLAGLFDFSHCDNPSVQLDNQFAVDDKPLERDVQQRRHDFGKEAAQRRSRFSLKLDGAALPEGQTAKAVPFRLELPFARFTRKRFRRSRLHGRGARPQGRRVGRLGSGLPSGAHP